MAEQNLNCNYPKCKIPITGIASVTSCSHIFCKNHFIRGEGIDRRCPSCNSVLEGDYDVSQNNINPSDEMKWMMLTGYSPEVVFDITSRALMFWDFQMNMKIKYHQSEVKYLRIRLAQKLSALETMELNIKHYIKRQEEKVQHLKGEVEAGTAAIKDLEDQLRKKNIQLSNMQSRYEGLRRQSVAFLINKETEEPMDTDPQLLIEPQNRYINRQPAPPTPTFEFRPNTPRNTPCSFTSFHSTPRSGPGQGVSAKRCAPNNIFR